MPRQPRGEVFGFSADNFTAQAEYFRQNRLCPFNNKVPPIPIPLWTHAELFRVAASLDGDFLMTHDDATELHDLANQHGFDTMLVAMKNTHHAKMKELLIGRNLDWARSLPI